MTRMSFHSIAKSSRSSQASNESFPWDVFKLTGASIFFFLGVPPNLLSIAFIFRGKQPKSSTTYFFLNLAIADIVKLSSVLLTAIILMTEQHLSTGTEDTIMTISLPPKVVANLILALIALERYNALVKTMNPFLNLGKKHAKIVSGVIWLIAIATQVPVFIYRLHYEGGNIELVRGYFIVCIITTYFFPLLVISYCYGKILKGVFCDSTILAQDAPGLSASGEKKRFVRITMIVTVIYMVFNLPAATVKILKIAGYKVSGNDLFCIVLLLNCVSSTVNPYIYVLQSERYREQVRELFGHKQRNNTTVAREE